MRTAVKVIIAIVVIVALVFGIRTFACTPKATTLEAQDGVEDPTYTNYTSDNKQATLCGFYLDNSQSNDDIAVVYVAFKLTATDKNKTSVDAYAGSSLVRFLSLDDTTDYSDTTTQTTATAADKIGYKTAAYAYSNTIQDVSLDTSKATYVLAVFSMDRATLSSATTVSIWLDVCTALENTSSSAIGYDNVILSFPEETLRTVKDETDLMSILKDQM